MLLPVRDVLCGAQSGHGPENEVEEAAGVVDHTAEGVHVHHTHVPQSLARREVGEDLDTDYTHKPLSYIHEHRKHTQTGEVHTEKDGTHQTCGR